MIVEARCERSSAAAAPVTNVPVVLLLLKPLLQGLRERERGRKSRLCLIPRGLRERRASRDEDASASGEGCRSLSRYPSLPHSLLPLTRSPDVPCSPVTCVHFGRRSVKARWREASESVCVCVCVYSQSERESTFTFHAFSLSHSLVEVSLFRKRKHVARLIAFPLRRDSRYLSLSLSRFSFNSSRLIRNLDPRLQLLLCRCCSHH